MTRNRRLRLGAVMAAVALMAGVPTLASAQSVIRDTEIETILRRQADPVLEAAGLEPDDVRLLLISDQSLNAFATQGQIMGVNTGLILETENPNQLLGVIAHEAGHLAGGHTVRGEMQRAGMTPFLLTLGLGVVAALAGAPDAGIALAGSSGYFGALGALNYSRSQEGAADQAGLQAMERAGYSGRGLVEFFEKFRYQEVFSLDRQFPYFRAHPLSSQRIDALRRRAERLPNYNRPDPPEWQAEHELVKAKLYAFLNHPNQTLRRYPETDTSFPARYARAIALYRDSQIDRAVAAIDQLLEEQPDNPYLWELKGQVLFEGGRPVEAVPAHRRSVELLPEAALLRINLGQALLATHEAPNVEEAIRELNRANLIEDDNAIAWRLLSEAHAEQGQDGMARLAAAEYQYAIGDRDQARVFALRARDALPRGSTGWVRAVDIVLQSGVTDEDLEDLDRRNERENAS
ncbi:M48 family metalloprotease [Brevundimonas sp. 2R-24]|uniref:M48 family metalloprotease n=1 Tax=Peiella sedimenti TaxID=3061083 RepID=A0ABT8SIQ5_9CAUL|nr:M48 family metalloprotease [Caulobacteraceae bacterium XZ-24]